MSSGFLRCAGGLVRVLGMLLVSAPGLVAKPHGSGKLTPEMLDELATEYRAAGLPVPPADAPLLLLEFSSHETDRRRRVKDYVPGFQLTPGNGKDRAGTFLVGTEVLDPDRHWKLDGPSLAVDPEKPLTVSLYQGEAHFATFPTEIWLDAAIQCQMRGYRGLARQIVEQNPMRIEPFLLDSAFTAQNENDPAANTLLYRATNGGDPHLALAAAAWNHWLNAVVSPDTDRREALAYLEKLWAGQPAFRGRERARLLAGLRETVRPSRAEPGSPEALIDGLADGTQAGMEEPDPAKGCSDPNLTRLLELGFAAMPALIEHMKDRRFVRGVGLVLDGPPSLATVGSLITGLVEAAEDPGMFPGGKRPPHGSHDPQELARQWWVQASAAGEEAYVRGHAIPTGKTSGVNAYCAWIVGRRYPQHLGEIYERALRDRPELDSGYLAATVAACGGLDREERLRWLRTGAESPNLARREDALKALFPLDPADANARTRRELDRLPTAASDPSNTYSPEDAFVSLMQRSDSPEVWEAFTATAQRVGPELRAKWVWRVNNTVEGEASPEQRARRIDFLRALLNDTTRWSDGEYDAATGTTLHDWTGPHADLTHVVGNRAATKLGELLKLPNAPSDYSDKEEWARFRADVVIALGKL